jgi:glycosidase
MQWDESAHAGFAPPHVTTTWLPVHPSPASVSVATQQDDPESLLACYRRLLGLRRRSQALSSGRLELMDPARHPHDVLAFRRSVAHEGRHEAAHVFLNFSDREQTLDLAAFPHRALYSNLHDPPRNPQRRYPLSAFEGIVLLDHAASRS